MNKMKKIDEYLKARRDHSYFIAATLKAAVEIERVEQEIMCDGDLVAILKDGGVFDWMDDLVTIEDGKLDMGKKTDDSSPNATPWHLLEETKSEQQLEAEIKSHCDEDA